MEDHEKPIGKLFPYTNEERRKLESLIKQGMTLGQISEQMKRSQASISIEIRRSCTGSRINYDAEKSINRARENFKKRSDYAGRSAHLNQELLSQIKELIARGYSKNRISLELKIGKGTVERMFSRYNLQSTDSFTNEKRINDLESKIMAIELSIEILFNKLNQGE